MARLIFMVGLRPKPLPARSPCGWERGRDVGAEKEGECFHTYNHKVISVAGRTGTNVDYFSTPS